jgi:hypothetical protein
MHEMTEPKWMAAERRDPSKTYVEVDVPPLWRSKAFVLIAALALVCAGGVLKSVYQIWPLIPPAHGMQDAGQTGFYDRDATIGPQGGDKDPHWRPLTKRDGKTKGAGKAKRVNSDQSGANQGRGPVSSPPASAASRN